MADLERIVVQWSAAQGLPGVSVFFGDLAGNANASIKTFFTAIQSLFPAGLTWVIPGSGDLVDSGTGALSGTWINGAGGGTVVASGAANYAAGCGAYVIWGTGAIVNGRRLKGRTFLAPLINSAYDAGTIVNANRTTLETAAAALVAAGNTNVWHRPVNGAGGVASQPTSATVPDQVTSLKTRRR